MGLEHPQDEGYQWPTLIQMESYQSAQRFKITSRLHLHNPWGDSKSNAKTIVGNAEDERPIA